MGRGVIAKGDGVSFEVMKIVLKLVIAVHICESPKNH